MGIEIKSESVNLKQIKRCNGISIDAPYTLEPTITQHYEIVTLLNDVFLKTEKFSNETFQISNFYDVEIDVNGKKITGAEVAQFFFTYNDLPKE